VTLNKQKLQEIPCLLPPLPEQKKIAEILSGIDKAISIKRIRHERRLIAANLIFESLLSNIESRQAALSQIAHLERGKFSHRPRNDPAYYGGLYPFIQTGDIPKTGVAIREHKQTLNEKGLKVSRQFPAGTLVITIAATIGEVGILSYPACFPDSLVGIDPHKDKCDPVYLLFLLRRLKNTLLQMAPQSAQSNLNLEILGKLSVPLPSLPDQQRFSRMITCEDKRASAEDIEIMKLQYLKTAVANNLLSGRKRVTL
jgi:type I restriction enzyme S subunit